MAERRPDRTLGPVHQPFWDYAAKGELRIQRCGACREYNWPAVAACENCASPDLAWERISGLGQIVSHCTFERDYYGGMLPMPWPTMLVRLEEGPLMVSNPFPGDRLDMKIAMPVSVRFIECEDKAGTFMLPVFGWTEAADA